ncbi:DUF6907 domain-containing protein [Nocardia niigatensis]
MKAAARAYQQDNPGITFPEALRVVDTRVPVQCPTWCDDHYQTTPSRLSPPGDGHYGAKKWILAEAGEPDADQDLQMFVQLVSHDQYRARSTTINVVLPDENYAAMDSAQAHRVADLLSAGADQLRIPVPAVGACPSWCIEHPDPEMLDPGAGVHYGQEMLVPACGPLSTGSHAGVRLRAFDVDDERIARLSLIVPREAVDLTEVAARQVAEALRAAAVTCDSVATTTNSIPRPPR